MKAIQFLGSIPRYAFSTIAGKIHSGAYYNTFSNLQLIEKEPPALPTPQWVKIKPYYSGICGSDINLITLKDSPYTSPFVSFPFVMGHENCGTIVETGPEVDNLKTGMRVVVDPMLTCNVRGFAKDQCPPCKTNNQSRCLNFRKGCISPGLLIGTCKDTGGSWSDAFVAHSENVYPLPESMDWETAALIDSFASAVHPVARHFPETQDRVLIIGGGPVGLCVLLALRSLGFEGNVSIMVKYPFQEKIAQEAGADNIIYFKGNYKETLANIFDMELLSPMLGEKVPLGGPEKIFDCIGSSSSLKDSLSMAGPGGNVVLVGLASFPKGIDWTPIWLKELSINGIFTYSTEFTEEDPISTYELSIRLATENNLPLSSLLTHTFPLEEYKKAMEYNLSKSRHGLIKSAFKI